MSKVGVIGAGGWALGLAILLNNNGHNVTVWSKISAEIDAIRTTGENTKSLPGVKIPKEIEQGEAKSMYKLILTVVNKGKAEDVVDAAREKGARGGTIINARGSGVNENFKVFNMDIEPEKEMVMIIVAENLLEPIMENIQLKLALDQPGNGVLFVQDLNRVYGIYEQNN